MPSMSILTSDGIQFVSGTMTTFSWGMEQKLNLDGIQFVSGTMTTFSQGDGTKIKSSQFCPFLNKHYRTICC